MHVCRYVRHEMPLDEKQQCIIIIIAYLFIIMI